MICQFKRLLFANYVFILHKKRKNMTAIFHLENKEKALDVLSIYTSL